MSIQAIPVFENVDTGGGSSGGFVWPDITYTGTNIKRYAKQYGGIWYAEYALCDYAVVSVNVNGSGVVADFYLVSPGQTGASGTSSMAGAAGGAGAPFSWFAVTAPAGKYTFTCNVNVSSVAGAIGTLSAAPPAGGYPVGSAYNLFGDPNEQYGTVIAPTSAAAIIPGKGAGGCTYAPVSAPSTVYGSSSTRVSVQTGAVGVGAGGNGGSRTDYMATALGSLNVPGSGANGMILMRVAL